MSSKTLKLIRQYHQIIKEQGEENAATPPSDPSQDVTENPQPTPEDTMPLTSEAENKYIEDLIDAALFEPSPDESRTLLNLQSAMQMKRYKNAREEILPTILGIIGSSSSGGDFRKALNKIQ